MSADHLYGQYLSHLEIRNLEVPFGLGLMNAKLWLVSKFLPTIFGIVIFSEFLEKFFLNFLGINFETIPVLK